MNTHVTLALPVDPLTPEQSTARKLSYALYLAKLGMYIAPLQPDSKLPYMGESWLTMRSRDEATIRRWFKERPGMNYAVSPGENFVVLDLDTKKGKDGRGDLLRLSQDVGNDFNATHEETFTTKTPSTGAHLYYSTGGVPYSIAHTLPKSIDVRGNDGYVVGPGCHTTHNPITGTFEGDYEIINPVDIAPLPEWIKPHLKQWVPRDERPSYEDEVEERDGKKYVNGVELDTDERMQRAIEWLKNGAKPAIEHEGGNETTFKTFAWLREHAISSSLALALVKTYYNPRACRRVKPGEDKFVPSPWSPEELERIRDNAYKYAKREVSHDGGMAQQFLSEEEITAGMQSIDSSKFAVADADAVKTPASLRAHTFVGPAALDYPAQKEFIVPRVLPAYGYVGFLARRGTGKTTVMLDMALRLAHDMDWHGQPMKTGWGAIYLAGEDAEGAKDQIEAWLMFHGMRKSELSERFVFMDAIPNLLTSTGVTQTWIPHLVDIAAGRRCAVFADTWQMATATGKQNEDSDMQTAIANTKAIGRALRGPAIMAAHPPKGNEDTWSGNAVMENASQAIWKLSKETFGLKFSVPRIKGARADYYALFDFKTQMLGRSNEWRQPETGIVPVKLGGEGLVQTGEQATREDRIRQAIADAACSILLESDERRGDDGKAKVWSGRKMSEEIVRRHEDPTSPVKLPDNPGKADTLARSFPGWFENKSVEVRQRGPGGIRLGVRMVRAKGNAWVFEVVELRHKPADDDTIRADE